MEKLEFLKDIVNPKLLDEYLKAAEKDIVLKKSIEKTEDLKTFVNSIMAALVCIVAREEMFAKEISNFINAHPDITQAIMSKQIKDSIQKQKLENEQ